MIKVLVYTIMYIQSDMLERVDEGVDGECDKELLNIYIDVDDSFSK